MRTTASIHKILFSLFVIPIFCAFFNAPKPFAVDHKSANLFKVKSVLDGRTLQLADGRVVRLSGLPETGEDEARLLKQLIGEQRIIVVLDEATASGGFRDEEGRYFAFVYVWNFDRRNLPPELQVKDLALEGFLNVREGLFGAARKGVALQLNTVLQAISLRGR